ncbi:hypothetical protein GF420_14590, partial [candidate division GN15 bacterium]|nr:hypothetical protein [candidate division GN15 bacterium]
GGVNADPLLADTSAGDFSLLDGSPAIDAGLDLGYWFHDSAPDIGAVEYIPANVAPEWSDINDTTIAEAQALALTLSASDPDGTTPTLTAEDVPLNAGFTDNGDGTGSFTFTPDYTQAGEYAVRFIAADTALADTLLVEITVTNVNRPPILQAIGAQSVEEGQSLTAPVTATDPDGATPVLTAVSLPTNAVLTDNGDGSGEFGFTPGYAQEGAYSITFIASDGALADSETVVVTVTPAPIVSVRIQPDSAIVEVYDSLQFAIAGYDAGDVLVHDLTDSVVWGTDDPTGTIGPAGLYKAGDVVSPPDYSVYATYKGVMIDSAQVRVISDGSLDYVQIEWLDGTPVGDTMLTTDDDGTVVYCRGYDIADALLGDVAVNWTWTSGTVGSLAQVNGTSTSLTLTSPGTDRLAVELTPTMVDTSGTITVTAGVPAELVVSPDEATVSVDSSLDFSTVTLDADGNLSNPQVVPVWTVLGGIGDIDAGGHFLPSTVGSGAIVASTGGLGIPICPPGMVHFWPLDKTTGPPYEDISGGNDADCIECPNGVAGQVGHSLDFDGDDEFISAASGADISSAMTVMAWIRPGGLFSSHDEGIVSKKGAFTLELEDEGNNLAFRLINGASSDEFQPILLSNYVPLWNWTHVAATYDGSTVAIYLDGTLIDSRATSITSLGNNAEPYTIGWTSDLSWGSNNYFNGRIDEVAVFDRALSPGEVQAMYLRGESGEAYCETVVLGLADTSGTITVTPGDLVAVSVVPDSIVVSADSSVQYEVEGYDSYGNPRDPGTITWSVTTPIGTIDGGGLFEAGAIGTGQVVAASDLGPVDTTQSLEVVAGGLARLEITPAAPAVGIGDTIQFDVIGLDADDNETDAGEISWDALGRIGDIDSTGLFVATAAGKGKVTAVSSLNGITDTSDFIDVDEVYVSPIPLGTSTIRPGATRVALMTLSVYNYFDTDKTITGLTVRDASAGTGTPAQLLSNIDSLAVYLDKDNDSLLSEPDSVLAWAPYDTSAIALPIDPFVLGPDASATLLFGAAVYRFPHDGDSLDIYIKPEGDITIEDGTIAVGPDSANSLGVAIVDGLIASQLRFTPTGTTLLEPGDSVYHVLTLDIPRNGYEIDTLSMLSLSNSGTAGINDFDSLLLFVEESNGIWNGAANETPVGRMYYTGDRWTISGLSQPLAASNTRFYVGAVVAQFPTNGASFVPGLPIDGIEVVSNNDGPADSVLAAIETFTIETFEALSITSLDQLSSKLTPGQMTPSLLSVRLTNTYSAPVAIDSFTFTLESLDSAGASQDELDSQIDSVLLYIRDGIGNNELVDSLAASGTISDGAVTVHTSGLTVDGNGGNVAVSLRAQLSLYGPKNNNSIGFIIEGQSDIHCTPAVTIDAAFPLENAKTSYVDAFPAAAVVVNPVASQNLFGGQTDQLVFDFELPRNGYAIDMLTSIRLRNLGTLADDEALSAVTLWADDGSDDFTVDDAVVGQFTQVGPSWLLDKFSYPLLAETTRFFVTVDISPDDREGGTLQFEIPADGISYTSGADGPDDLPVANPEAHVVFQSNRVTAIALPAVSSVVNPGDPDNVLLTLALYNGYVGREQQLDAVTVQNRSISGSDQAFADAQLGQVALYFDADRNRILSDDSLVATGYFADGSLQFSGIDISMPPESLSYFFVVADLAEQALDSDSLAVSIDRTTDFTFASPVLLNGDFPLQSGGYLIVDGSVRRQYRSLALDARTLRPGDTLVPVFAFLPAANGDQLDVLQSLQVDNLQTAGSGDFDQLTLWLDTNADSVWQATDSLLGVMSGDGTSWSITGLAIDISRPAPALFVLCDVALLASPGASIQLQVPVNGCQYQSANDGPLDLPLTGDNTFVVSTSGLRISNVPLKTKYSVGQQILVATNVTNVLAQPMDSVFGAAVAAGPVQLDSATAGPVALAPGESTTFAFHYTADSVGTATWQLSAFETTIPDSSAIVSTAEVALQAPPSDIPVQLINSIPAAVTKGQTNIFPMSISYQHPGTDATTASVRLDSLVLSVRDGSGVPQSAATAFKRIVLASGYSTLAALETVPDQTDILLEFTEPVIVDPADAQL